MTDITQPPRPAVSKQSASDAGLVWVYRYTYWDENTQSQQTSMRFATLEAIRNGLGMPIHAEAKKATLADLIDGIFSD